ncbi:MAG TPA: hypothetical protein VMQ44_01005 [Candidatus Saccharimonadales bacterium]|nr:hypothetical protein [Candidatus Saccharimonadales bacterium]
MRKKYYYIAGIIIAVSALAGGAYAIVKHSLRATSPISPPTQYHATVSVNVIENGQDGFGVMDFGGDCPETPVPSQEGGFTCTFTSNNPNINLTGISYASYISNKNYRLPITPGGSVESQPLKLTNGQAIQLQATINSAGVLTLQQYQYGKFVTVPSDAGITVN